jgi:hypothetical protein
MKMRVMVIFGMGALSAQAETYRCNFNTERGLGVEQVLAVKVPVDLGMERTIQLQNGGRIAILFQDGERTPVSPANYFKGMNILTVNFFRSGLDSERTAFIETYVPKGARMFGTNAGDKTGRFISITCHKVR